MECVEPAHFGQITTNHIDHSPSLPLFHSLTSCVSVSYFALYKLRVDIKTATHEFKMMRIGPQNQAQ